MSSSSPLYYYCTKELHFHGVVCSVAGIHDVLQTKEGEKREHGIMDVNFGYVFGGELCANIPNKVSFANCALCSPLKMSSS